MDPKRIALRIVYWLAVLVVSLALVLALVLLFESLDQSSVSQGSWVPPRGSQRL